MKYKDLVIRLYVTIGIYCCNSIFCQNDLIIGSGSLSTDCETFRVYYLDEATNYTINWLGEKPTSFCKLNFKGRGTEEGINNKYKICVHSISYIVLDCDTEINLYFEHVLPDKVYDCKNAPDTNAVCGEEDKYFTLSLKSRNKYANLNIYPSRFSFLVTAIKTYDGTKDRDTGPSIILFIGVGIGLMVAVLFTFALVSCIRRKKQTKNQQLNDTTYNPTETDNSQPALLTNTEVEATAPSLAEINSFEDIQQEQQEPSNNRIRHCDQVEEINNDARRQRHYRREHRRNDHSDNASQRQDRQREQLEHRRRHQHSENRSDPSHRSVGKVFDDPPPSYEMVMNAKSH